jgi:hypothetical protein
MSASEFSANQLLYFTVPGKSAQPFLGEDQFIVDTDLIHTPGRGDEFDIGIIFFLQISFQPGSTRLIVSSGTVLDGNFHGCLAPSLMVAPARRQIWFWLQWRTSIIIRV